MAVEPFPNIAVRKTRDLFICGAYTTDALKAALAGARILRQSGFNIDIEEGSITYEEYRQRVVAARRLRFSHMAKVRSGSCKWRNASTPWRRVLRLCFLRLRVPRKNASLFCVKWGQEV